MLIKALDGNGVTSMADLLTLDDETIGKLQYRDDQGQLVPVLQSKKNIVKILKAWNRHLIGIHMTKRVDWTDETIITEDEWDEYRVSDYDPDITKAQAALASMAVQNNIGTTTSGKPPPVITTNRPSNLVNDFKKGVKRDKSHYHEFKDEGKWDEWRRGTLATARAHGCMDIFDHNYVPSNKDEQELFNEMQNFMYDVFNDKLRTSMGLHYVRSYEGTSDAQAVWRDLENYMCTSTKAELDQEELMNLITSSRLTNNYRGKTLTFVTDWLDYIRRHDKLTPLSSRMSDVTKKHMLQNALQHHDVFIKIKDQEMIDIARGLGSMSYIDYVNVVQKLAGRIDKQKSPVPNAMRRANFHDFSSMNSSNHEDDSYDLASFDSFSANAHQFRGKRPSLPKAIWQGLNKQDQEAWDRLSSDAKWSVMFAYKDK